MKCPGCKRDIEAYYEQCENCGYIFRILEENHLLNRILSQKEDLGTLSVGDKVKLNIPEGVWHGAQGIIIDTIHKYYKVQLITGSTKTSTIIKVPHNQVIKL